MTISSIREVDKVASLRVRIRKTLAAAIVSGKLAPSSMVTVPALAAEFEVSATPELSETGREPQQRLPCF